MSACNRLHCGGTIDPNGYCDVCGLRPLPDSPSRITGSSGSSVSSPTSLAQGDGPLVELPVFPQPKPLDAVLTDPVVAEQNRFCQACGHKVGRSRGDGLPGLTRGFCPKDGTPFSFVPALKPGRLVDGRYDVVGAIAHGGVGWVYLAKDIRFDRDVVLKGLINTADRASLDAAVAERRYLTFLNHQNIVHAYDLATDTDPETQEPLGYLVLEYIGGKSLRKVIDDVHENDLELTIEHVIGYGLEILKALGYVHRLGLLHCDIKPDNVMTGGGQVRLIDLGAMRRLTDKGTVWGDPHYQVPKAEIREYGLGVDSDLYSLGRTLIELLEHSVDHQDSDRHDRRISGSVESFVLVAARAAHVDRRKRFTSAAEMAEQLTLVLREILAVRGGRRIPMVSTHFAPEFARFDDGLGDVVPLSGWVDEPARVLLLQRPLLADGRPSSALVARRLPDLLPDPLDPNTPALATVSASDPALLIEELRRMRDSVELELWRCRARLAMADPADRARARDDLAAARAVSGNDRHHWRIDWHEGLVELALAKDDVDIDAAAARFGEVLAAVPGEAAPKVVLGYCAEATGRTNDAQRYYDEVWRADDTQVSAAFGLARLKLAVPDRRGAVDVLDSVPRLSRHHNAARIAAVRVLAGTLRGARTPSAADLDAAANRLAALDERGAGVSAADRLLLTVTVLRAAVEWANAANEPPERYQWGAEALARFGSPVTPDALRSALSTALTRLARDATDADQHDVLIDYANLVRPRSRT